MANDVPIPLTLYDLADCLAGAMDLVSPVLANHHKQVGYLAFRLGQALGMSPAACGELALAGMVHDVGALSLRERLECLGFEDDAPSRHTEAGYYLLRLFQPLANVANMVRFHHHPWRISVAPTGDGAGIPTESHILHLADRIAVAVEPGRFLDQAEAIARRIGERSGSVFQPDLVAAFIELSAKEYFWLDLCSAGLGNIMARLIRAATMELGLDDLLILDKLFSHIIDFRSPFTAAHSSGVAAVAEALAGMSGFAERECLWMRLAGYLHDLGKLAVPTEILEKQGRLTQAEFRVIRSHSYHTFRLLEAIPTLKLVNTWGAFHHERLNGSGYPFHHRGDDLSLGSRIMAVADVFTGITENRPYRPAMDAGEAMDVLRRMADNAALDGEIVVRLQGHFATVNDLRARAQAVAADEYSEFWCDVGSGQEAFTPPPN